MAPDEDGRAATVGLGWQQTRTLLDESVLTASDTKAP